MKAYIFKLSATLLTYISLAGVMTSSPTMASDDSPAQSLKRNDHVLMIRHALAPGNGDPDHFELRDCSTQRNLDTRGRAQARRIGMWLRRHGLDNARVYSSQWCRCLETARLLGVGEVQELPSLNSFYQRDQDREPNLRALREFLDELPRAPYAGPVILVTHYVTVGGVADVWLGSGEGVVLEITAPKQYRVVERLEFSP